MVLYDRLHISHDLMLLNVLAAVLQPFYMHTHVLPQELMDKHNKNVKCGTIIIILQIILIQT